MQHLKQLVRLATDKKYRRWVAVAVIVLTFGLVIRFFAAHPEYLEQLRHVPPSVIIAVILINVPALAALIWAYDSLLRLCGKPLGITENTLLTAYSSILNFFGPLQSGPGVRAVYLKTRHKVRVRDYMLATLIYYALFASFSALFLLVGMRPWWQTVLAVVAAAGFSAFVIRLFIQRGARKAAAAASSFALRPGPLAALIVAVFLQLVSIAGYYFVELRAVNPAISVSQAISYTGAANFALFVSLTPDAVGFREAFLVFSQQIHHVATQDIVNANIIDRGAYLLFLGVLFIFTLAVHARDRLHLKNLQRSIAQTESH